MFPPGSPYVSGPVSSLTDTEERVGNKSRGVKLRSEMAAAATLWGEQCVHTLTPPSALLSTHRALKAYLGGTLGASWAHRVTPGAKLTPCAAPPPSGLTDAAEEPHAQMGPISGTVSPGSVSGWVGGSAGLCTFPFQLKSRFELKICRLASRAAVRTEEVLCSLSRRGRARRKPRRYWIKSHGAAHRANLGHRRLF